MSKITKQKDGGLLVSNVPTIPFITGDGVGAEITPVMQAVAGVAIDISYGSGRHIEWKEVLAGEHAFRATGSWLSDETMEAFKEYLIGIKEPLIALVDEGTRSLNVILHQTSDLYVCLRPVRWFRGVVPPVKEPEKVNMHISRENTEDIYVEIEREAGIPETGEFYKSLHDEMGVSKVRFSETFSSGVKPVPCEGTEHLVHAVCRYALQYELPSTTLVCKGNIMKFTEGGFKKWGYELAEREFSNVVASGKLVVEDCTTDALLQSTPLIPEDYSVITTSNPNGDYISDQSAAMVGGIGIAPGANINYDSGHATFEAIHGTAPSIVGKKMVSPCLLILSTVMMLEYLGWQEPADLIVEVLEASLVEEKITNDLAHFMYKG